MDSQRSAIVYEITILFRWAPMLHKIKYILKKGILADQSGLDTLEYVAIAGSVLLVLLLISVIILSIML